MVDGRNMLSLPPGILGELFLFAMDGSTQHNARGNLGHFPAGHTATVGVKEKHRDNGIAI
jgi:hypothetical protein